MPTIYSYFIGSYIVEFFLYQIQNRGTLGTWQRTQLLYKKLLFGLLVLLCVGFLFIFQSLLGLGGVPVSIYGGPISFLLIQVSLVSDHQVWSFVISALGKKAQNYQARLDSLLACWPNRVQPANQLISQHARRSTLHVGKRTGSVNQALDQPHVSSSHSQDQVIILGKLTSAAGPADQQTGHDNISTVDC